MPDPIGDLLEQARQRPDDPAILRELGIALVSAGRASEAVPFLRRLAALRPTDHTAFHQLGDALAFTPDLADAAAALRRAIELRPDYAPPLARLGNVLRLQRDYAGAIDAFERAARLDPSPDILSNLADSLVWAGRAEEAIEPLKRALSADPGHLLAHVNLSCALMRLGNVDPALEEIRSALRTHPDFAPAHYYLALALLKRGDLKAGWEEFEWRLRLPRPGAVAKIDQALPRWHGETLPGRTLLLHAEQGFGDAIQFARYIPLVIDRAGGAKVIVACHAALHRLMASIAGINAVVDSSQALSAGADVQCPLMSLPRVFGTTMETIPATTPYLSAPADLVETWRRKLAPAAGRKVGLSWAGRPGNSLNHYRSCRFAHLAPLFDVPGVTFFSLQKGEGSEELHASPLAGRVIDHTTDLHDLADTAALVASLDLVISIDSAPAHLAGALGRPTWAILSCGADWRYHVGRDDSPWYPTMRLFRQHQVGQWDAAIRRVAAELSTLR